MLWRSRSFYAQPDCDKSGLDAECNKLNGRTVDGLINFCKQSEMKQIMDCVHKHKCNVLRRTPFKALSNTVHELGIHPGY